MRVNELLLVFGDWENEKKRKERNVYQSWHWIFEDAIIMVERKGKQ